MTGQQNKSILDSVYAGLRVVVICSLCFLTNIAYSQEEVIPADTMVENVTDFSDILKKIFKKSKGDSIKPKQSQTIALLPSIGYNPSFGFVIGAKVSAIKQFGEKGNTDLSAFGLEFLYTSKGIITAQARHNVFTAGNKWNFQGNWQLSKFMITDYNIGTGNADYRTGSDSSFLIRFNYVRLTEKVYKAVGHHLYAGIGVSMNIRYKIDDDKLKTLSSTPHYRYSQRNELNPERYSSNAVLLAIQYNTREHPLRSYGGIYADFNFVVDQKWLGSTKTAVQVIYDFRKYFSLSSKRPEHVLAFWHLGSYRIDGTIPYLSLPATGYDLYNRSGRGYTIGRFKGPAYAYFESEYRFPITRNKLISGVAFINVSTASDDMGKKIFQYLDHAAGGGLRVLFKKESRSTICIDYAKGKYGSGGFFFGLNEVF